MMLKHKQEIHDERGKLQAMILKEILSEISPMQLVDVLIDVYGREEAACLLVSFELYTWFNQHENRTGEGPTEPPKAPDLIVHGFEPGKVEVK